MQGEIKSKSCDIEMRKDSGWILLGRLSLKTWDMQLIIVKLQ